MKMPFGKYAGEDLEDIPTSYMEWALREWEFDSTERERLAEEMENQIRMRSGEGVERPRQK